MKNLKVLSLILCFVFVFSSLPAFAESVVLSGEDYANAQKLMQLVCPEFPLGDGETVTRAEFTAAVVMLIDNLGKAPEIAPFGDVPAEHEYASEIAFAKGMGLVSSVELFYPDTPISYAQAVKILVTALGYGGLASVKGSYPTGYMVVADDLDLAQNIEVGLDDSITHAQATEIIFEAACTDILEMTATGTDDDYTVKEGRNLLSVYKNIYVAEGLVEANQFTGIYSETKATGGFSIKIDGKEFFGVGYEGLIGKNARVFYGDDSKATILMAYALDNEEYTYTKENGIKLSGLTLTVYTEDGKKAKSFTLESDYSVIKNGKHYVAADYAPYLNPEAGTVSFISNDADSDIELIVIREIEYGVVGSVNVFDEIIFDSYKKNGMTNLADADYYFIHDTEGGALTLENIEAGDTLGFVKSKDNKYVEIIKYTNRVGGVFDSKSTDGKLYMADAEYELSSYYRDNVKGVNELKLGAEVILHLGEGNEVIKIEEFASSMQYGYIVQIHEGTNGMGDSNLIRIFGQNGKMNELKIGKKVYINGVSYNTAAAFNYLKPYAEKFGDYTKSDAAGGFLWRVVKFAANSKGELSKIYTTRAEKVTDLSPADQVADVYEKELIDEAQPKLFDNNTAHKFGNSNQGNGMLFFKNGVFYPYFKPTDNVVMFKVPVPKTDSTEWADPKNYSLSSIQELKDADIENVTCYGYDVDKNGANFILWSSDNIGSGTIAEEAASGVVESITKGVNEDGEEVSIIKMYTGGKWGKFYAISESSFGESSSDKVSKACLYGGAVKPGDMIGIALNGNNEIIAARLDFSFADREFKKNDGSGNIVVDTDMNVVNGVAKYNAKAANFIGGYIYSTVGTNAVIVAGKSMAEIESGSFGVANMKPASLSRGAVIYVKFNRDNTATVFTEPDTSTIESYFSAGKNADYIVQRSRYYDVSLTVVYVN